MQGEMRFRSNIPISIKQKHQILSRAKRESTVDLSENDRRCKERKNGCINSLSESKEI